jgi:hypothetical protein
MKMLAIVLALYSVGALAVEGAINPSTFFKDKTRIANPFELRDPFKAPLIKNSNSKDESASSSLQNGIYTNLVEKSLTGVSIQKIKVVGVLIGKERRAMVQFDTDISVTILKEGMKLGPDNAELKAILPGGIVLVEKIVNVYGQEEFLETVIPISR